VSKDTTHRILNEGELKPDKVEYWCGKSPDPEFAEKQAAIWELYLDPPDNALVLAVDEKTASRPWTPANLWIFSHLPGLSVKCLWRLLVCPL
jgi:hypothetical protein